MTLYSRTRLGLAMMLCLAGPVIVAGEASDIMIADFRDCRIAGNLTCRDVVPAYDRGGDGALLAFPAWDYGCEFWPGIILAPPAGFPDWNSRRYLALDVVNEGDSDAMLLLSLFDADRQRTLQYEPLRPGEVRTCSVDLSGIGEVKRDRIREIHIFMEQPSTAAAIRIRNLRLTDVPFPAAQLDSAVAAVLESIADCRRILSASDEWSAELAELEDEERLLRSDADTAAKMALCRRPERRRRFDDWIRTAESCRKQTAPLKLTLLPASVKLRQDQVPDPARTAEPRLDAARGEAECLQLLLTAATVITDVEVSCSGFTDGSGQSIFPVLHLAGYVPVRNPTRSPYGFGVPGKYPDPLIPNRPFTIPGERSQALYLEVRVPGDAAPGDYRATVKITARMPHLVMEVPLELTVHNAIVPLRGKLKNVFMHQPVNVGNWNQGTPREFILQNLEYRINLTPHAGQLDFDLPWSSVFKVGPDGTVAADWSIFDPVVEDYLSRGKNTFQNYSPAWLGAKALKESVSDVDLEVRKMALVRTHLREKNWTDYFVTYAFDEPQEEQTAIIRENADFFHRGQGTDAHVTLTCYRDSLREYLDFIDIFVPHINVFRPDFAAQVRAQGGHVWVYTCVITARSRFPDGWKLDSYGTGPRALGWWMFQYGVEGYLYWGVDYWLKNPWEETEFYPEGNGDGYLFYPALEAGGKPYPSLRLLLLRDGFEDYELLTLLRNAADSPEAGEILSCRTIIPTSQCYAETGDLDFIVLHRRILELLDRGR